MRQVGPRPAASGIAIAMPRRSPVPARRRRGGALVAIRRKWLLHRRLLVRLGIGVFCALALTAGFEMRGGILNSVEEVAALISGRLADSGLGVTAIQITGQSITSEADIVGALRLDPDQTIFDFDADAARQRVLSLPAVATALVRKSYPNHITVEVSEKTPIARWRVDGTTFLIDARGEQLGVASSAADKALPMVIGSGAADDAQVVIRALAGHDDLRHGLVALSRIADRRWDLLYDTGLRVQLPEAGLGKALSRLETYQRKHRLLDRDLSLIDLRVEGIVAVQVVDRSDKSKS